MDMIQLPTGTEMRGLHLKDPHGAMIARGKKTHIAKGKPFDMSGPWILVSGGVAYGTINVAPPEAVSEAEFIDRFDEHRVTKHERRKWWPDRKVLYLSEITSFEAFEDRPLIHVEPHMQTVVESVEFEDPVPECLEGHCQKVKAFIEDEPIEDKVAGGEPAGLDQPEPEPIPVVVLRGPNALDLLISRIHQSFTVAADDMLAFGYVTQDQRISLSGAIGDALDRFNEAVDDVGLDVLRLMPLTDEHALFMASKEAETENKEAPKEGVKPMPYDPGNPPEKISHLPAKTQRQWVHVFNSCMEKHGDEGRCHKMANGVVKGAGNEAKAIGEGQGVGGPKQGAGGVDQCVCPKCGATAAHERGAPCTEQKCPKCGATMVGQPPKDAEVKSAAFKTFIAKDGRPWILTWTTNAYRDREGETFRTKALEQYVERHADQEVKGEYWFWHVPGTKFADIHWQAMVGRFLVEAGPFDDTPVGRKMAEFFSEYPNGHPEIAPEGWGTSHGYLYLPSDRKDGVYDWLEKFETTVLPWGVASNQNSPKVEVLRMNKQQEAALAAIVGPDGVEEVVETTMQKAEELEEKGVSWKEAGHLAVEALSKEKPPEMVMEEAVEDDDEEEETEETEEEEVKAVEDTEVVASKAFEDVARQIIAGLGLGELTTAVKENGATVRSLVEKLNEMDQRIKGLEDGGVSADTPLIPMPRSALWRASQSAQTETEDKAAANAPKVPDAIAEMARRMPV